MVGGIFLARAKTEKKRRIQTGDDGTSKRQNLILVITHTLERVKNTDKGGRDKFRKSQQS